MAGSYVARIVSYIRCGPIIATGSGADGGQAQLCELVWPNSDSGVTNGRQGRDVAPVRLEAATGNQPNLVAALPLRRAPSQMAPLVVGLPKSGHVAKLLKPGR